MYNIFYGGFFMPFARYLEAGGVGLEAFTPFLMIGALMAMFYFFIYKPGKKQERAVAEMRSQLKVGDEISTNGGILGKIIQIKDDFIVVETGAAKTKITLARWAVRAVEVSAESDDEDEEE